MEGSSHAKNQPELFSRFSRTPTCDKHRQTQAHCLIYGKTVDEFVRMRKITRSVKVAIKCLIAVVFVEVGIPYWPSKLSIQSHLRPLSATFVLRMRRSVYLWTLGVNLDTSVRFTDRDFLLECNISAIWRRFQLIFTFICWMSAIFLLPVCLTYWPRKYTTPVDPHVDNSHQEWSWYDHPLPSYSVLVCRYVTRLCDPDLWSFDLQQLKYMAGHVPTLPPRLNTLRLSVLELWVITFPFGYHWKCVRGHCACAESRDRE